MATKNQFILNVVKKNAYATKNESIKFKFSRIFLKNTFNL